MKYLLDTHILIWFLKGDNSFLTDEVINLIENIENKIYFSIVSLWEVAIKYSKNPSSIGISAENLAKLCLKANFYELLINKEHIFTLNGLKLANDDIKHGDPFDRMLIAQSKFEKMVLITHDSKIKLYNEKYVMIV